MEDIKIVDVEPKLVLGARKTGRYQELIPGLIKECCIYAAEKGVEIVAPPMFLCHEESKEAVMEADKAGNADVEIAVPIASKIEGTEEIKCFELPGGKMAKITHKGPYEQCEAAYDRLFAWIKQNGMKVVGPTREVYLNDPREVGQEEILTEIYAPVN